MKKNVWVGYLLKIFFEFVLSEFETKSYQLRDKRLKNDNCQAIKMKTNQFNIILLLLLLIYKWCINYF